MRVSGKVGDAHRMARKEVGDIDVDMVGEFVRGALNLKGIERMLEAGAARDANLTYQLITVRYGIHRCRALLSWCDETLATLQQLASRHSMAQQ
jgi:hypothetical protein